MKRLLHILFLIVFILPVFSYGQTLTLTSTENQICDGNGCLYEGPSILINEVMLSPYPFDGSIYGAPYGYPSDMCRGEWIELYNPDQCQSIDISCYFLGNAAPDSYSTYPGGFVIPENTIVPPRGFVIVRGSLAPAVPSNLLVQNGGNTIEIIINDGSRVCLGGGDRLWFPNSGGWFAFYDRNGVPQDAISWASVTASGMNACNPGPIGSCGYSGTLANYEQITEDRKNYISSIYPPENRSFRRIPDGGEWAYNSAAVPTYGTCNSTCIPEPVITCNGTARVNISGGTPPYSIVWNDGQRQTTEIATGLCEGEYCITVTDANNNSVVECIYVSDIEITLNIETSNTNYCIGETIELRAVPSNGNSPYTYSWEGPDGFTSSSQNPVITNAQLTASGTYSVTVYDSNSCQETESIDITVSESVQVTATNTGPYCLGETAQLNTQFFSSYSWTGPNNFASNSQNPTIPNIQNSNAGTYRVSVTNQYGCMSTAETTIEIKPTPIISITNTGPYCVGDMISLSCDVSGLPSYQWLGPNYFTSLVENPTINNATTNMSGTYTLTVTGTNQCTAQATTNVIVNPEVDATITPVPDQCITNPVVILNAHSNGGIWTGYGVTQNLFNPSVAGPGTHMISYSVGAGACSDDATTQITVYDEVFVRNFTDNTCDDINENYIIQFDAVDNSNSPTEFLVDYGNGFNSYSGNFSLTRPSRTSYSITVTDINSQCNEYIYEGYSDCGCLTHAGTMTSLQLTQLCVGECTSNITHNGNQVLDGNDVFQFILHNGQHPINILARNSTPEFCYNNIGNIIPGEIYYISAIAGNNFNGDPNPADTCYSISQGTPVVWLENPVAHITTREHSICSNMTTLVANEPPDGMRGYWTSNGRFFTIGGTTISDNEINIIVDTFGTYNFNWNIANGNCIHSVSVPVTFFKTPIAYAGQDFTICGNSASLEAIPSLEGTTGEWTGGRFFPANNPVTTVNVDSYGPHVFTWTENKDGCTSQDQIRVNFIREPNPIILNSTEYICGESFELRVEDIYGTGHWRAYNQGQEIMINFLPSNSSKTVTGNIGAYEGNTREITFTWFSTIDYQTITCNEQVSTTITFLKVPSARIDSRDNLTVCGNCVQLNALTEGSFTGVNTKWIPNGSYREEWTPDNNSPNTMFCAMDEGIYGDRGYADINFFWTIEHNHNNFICSSVDTVSVRFYRKPEAKAGLNRAECGNIHNLTAVFDIAESSVYTPVGKWNVVNDRLGADIDQTDQPSAENANVRVTVSEYGIWDLAFTEMNNGYRSCTSTDTVRIEFVKIPSVTISGENNICDSLTELSANDSGAQAGNWSVYPREATNEIESPQNNTTIVRSNIFNTPHIYSWNAYNASSEEFGFHRCFNRSEMEVTFWQKGSAVISTHPENIYACGNEFCGLQADPPGSRHWGQWRASEPGITIANDTALTTCVTASRINENYHFTWVVNIIGQEEGFCQATSDPFTVYFAEKPVAYAGSDTLFCGNTGSLKAVPTIGTGRWTVSQEGITIENPNSYNSRVISGDNYGEYTFTWIEDSGNGCTDDDQVVIRFVELPSSDITVMPPRCSGEPATIIAVDSLMAHYEWQFNNGIRDSFRVNSQGGEYYNFVHWNILNPSDSIHNVRLITTDGWNCKSIPTRVEIREPHILGYQNTIVSDTCNLHKGEIRFNSDHDLSVAFKWIDRDNGIVTRDSSRVYNLEAGDYDVRAYYRSSNTQFHNYYRRTFGTEFCDDTISITIPLIGMINADIDVDAGVAIDQLVVPAPVTFLNLTDYDNVRQRCEWHFGDGTTVNSCSPTIEHTYSEAGEYTPYLVVINRDLIECRDTAILDIRIIVGNQSSMEVPNVFSPNGDNINDYFQVSAESLESFHGRILNRWGNQVFEWSDWQNENAGWDGLVNGGSEASPGVYYFVIKAKGLDGVVHDIEGFLHLMR